MKTRKDIELERILAKDMKNVKISQGVADWLEGTAVLSVILHRELGLSVVESELMLEPLGR